MTLSAYAQTISCEVAQCLVFSDVKDLLNGILNVSDISKFLIVRNVYVLGYWVFFSTLEEAD